MKPATNRKATVAVDLGAQSCRVSLLRWQGEVPVVQVTHRFGNAPICTELGWCWDIERIVAEVQTGLQRCAELAGEGIATVAVDGWAVDYVRLARDGKPAARPFCYRDERTEEAERAVHAIVSPERLYGETGIQILRLNTIYQLYADKLSNHFPEYPWVNLPEYVTYCLSGRRAAEFTNATHTGLVELGKSRWNRALFEELGLYLSAAPEIIPTGTLAGPLVAEFARHPSLSATLVIFPACHDTASAIAAIPAVGDDWAFISSGTWSLVGTVLDSTCTTEPARRLNFTNLGGVGNKNCLLKNVNGMWLLRECLNEWHELGHRWTMPQIVDSCRSLAAPCACIDVDAPELMAPGQITQKINRQLEQAGQPTFGFSSEDCLSLANLIFHSLAARYAQVLSDVTSLTNKKLKRLFIVGGGSKNTYLNALTAKRTGLEVIPGSAESTTIGNLAIQLAASEEGLAVSSDGVSAGAVGRWAELLTRHTDSFSEHCAPY